ncbi:MAG TPA: aminotransferase class III-fold pyridoxal phosphate-dependent enzyme [Anaerolineae bacterium]|nr:aminotransferase class III-fold pyridoxal phosphate-dependent enzyme [Anaerolineae bacterium]
MLTPSSPSAARSSFGASPISFAAPLANVEVMVRSDLPRRARWLGERATSRLRRMQEEYPLIGDVRGLGLFIGVELVEDRETKRPATERAAALIEPARRQGLIFGLDMPDIVNGQLDRHNVVKIKPPLTITEEQLDRALDVFEATLTQVSQFPPEMLEEIRKEMVRRVVPDRTSATEG